MTNLTNVPLTVRTAQGWGPGGSLHDVRSFAALYSFTCIIPQAKQKFLQGIAGKGEILEE